MVTITYQHKAWYVEGTGRVERGFAKLTDAFNFVDNVCGIRHFKVFVIDGTIVLRSHNA